MSLGRLFLEILFLFLSWFILPLFFFSLQITAGNVEVAAVTPGGGYRMFSQTELENIIAKAKEEAASEN